MALQEWGQAIAGAKPPMQGLEFGPWAGSMRSRSAEQVPFSHLADGRDFDYLPRTGTWKRRNGQTVAMGGSHGSPVGHLPAQWGEAGLDQYSFPAARIRELQEFKSDSMTDGVPTIAALVTKEELGSSLNLDDGRFGTLWLRDQVNSVDYTLGEEYNTATYPAPGSVQALKIVPLRYDSGDGGITRGVDEYTRRFFLSGSRRILNVGNWWYFPNRNGTPARWNGLFNGVAAETQNARVTSASSNANWAASAGTQKTAIDDTTADTAGDPGDGAWDRFDASAGGGILTTLLDNLTVPISDPGVDTGFLLHLTLRSSAAYDARILVTLDHADGTSIGVSNIRYGGPNDSEFASNEATVTTSFVRYTYALSGAQCAAIDFTKQLRVAIQNGGLPASGTFDVAQLEVEFPGVASLAANRLIPSGPWAPTHAGTCTAGSQIENGESFVYPDSDVSDGGWLDPGGAGSDLYAEVDDTTDDDATYIQSSPGGTLAEFTLGNFGSVPGSDAVVVLRYRGRLNGSFPTTNAGEVLHVDIYAASTLCVSTSVPPVITSQNFTYTLTSAEISAITAASADWTGLSVKVYTVGGSTATRVSRIKLGHTPSTFTATDGGWKGSDQFYRGVAYVFEDDSLWMPCMPRGANDTLPSGFNLTTVDGANPTATYQKMTWANLPYLPNGFKGLALLRSDKIDSTTQSSLQLSPFSMKVVTVLPAGVTTYEDFFASDGSLVVDADKLFVRYDHKMPPCARYIAGGAQRVAVMYGKEPPCAIEIAPVGASADYDLNVADDSSTAYAARMYVRIALANDASMVVTLNKSNGSALTTKTLTTGATTTLQQLIDQINASSFASDSQQWRAQLCPGANPDAIAMTALLPHIRTINDCVVSGQTISKAGTGLQKVALGQRVSGTGVTAGAYITKVAYASGTTTLTFVGTITAATKNLSFYNELGDGESGDSTVNLGYQRVIANSLPGFLYFNNTHLAQYPDEDQAVYMTVANPLSVRSAANCFRTERDQVTNTFRPPRSEAGICTGGFGLDSGFVIWYETKRAVIVNTRDNGTGNDADYQMRIRNERRGCSAWNTIDAGSSFGIGATSEGLVACDLDNEILLSDDIFRSALSDGMIASGLSGVGDFAYELPASAAAAAADNDKSCMSAKIERGVIWVCYRATNAAVRNDRVVRYDFSAGQQSAGLGALVRSDDLVDSETGRVVAPRGSLFGWSLPHVYGTTPAVIGAGTRSDGRHIYGWHETIGSTGGGRVDELENGSTDNGTAIGSASCQLPWIQQGDDKLSVQEVVCWHNSPTGSTGALDYYRGFANGSAAQSFTLTVSGSNIVTKDRKLLKLEVRAVTDAGHFRFTQATGGAREMRKLLVKVFRTSDLKPAA